MKRTPLVILLLLVLIGAGGTAVYFVMGEDESALVAEEYGEAKALLSDDKPEQALELILKYSHRSEENKGPWHDYDWLALEIEAAEKMQSIPRLIYLLKENPASFDEREDTVLMLARIFLQFRQDEDFDLVREHWRGQEENEQAWFLLDSDYLMFQGRTEESFEILTSKKFEGEDDIPRLIRMALISSRRNLQEAWGYLTEAYNINWKSAEVRAFRAQILESVNQLALARVEFMASFAADPENPRTRDELAEFYRRNKQFQLALTTWAEGLDEFSADYVWSKGYFWNSMILPIKREWNATDIPEGNLSPFVSYMMDLPEGSWWDEEAFRVLPETRFYLTTRQETFWLRLFNELEQGKEAAALSLLEQNHFSQQSWAPELEAALIQILTFRLTGTLPPPNDISNGVPKAQLSNGDSIEGNSVVPANQFVSLLAATSLQDGEVPEDLRELLMSDEVFSATLLSSGWIQAGLRFNRLQFIPESLPRWLMYGLLQAKRLIEGNEAALAFAEKQLPDPVLNLIVAEMLVATERASEGVEALKELVESDSQVSARAAWVLATYHASQGDYNSAKVTVVGQPDLAKSTLGQELLARIAFLEGDVGMAEQLYTQLKEKSFVAKSFLAKRAFDRKDYAQAKQLTWEMIQRYPDVIELRANLKAIIEAENNAAGQSNEGSAE